MEDDFDDFLQNVLDEVGLSESELRGATKTSGSEDGSAQDEVTGEQGIEDADFLEWLMEENQTSAAEKHGEPAIIEDSKSTNDNSEERGEEQEQQEQELKIEEEEELLTSLSAELQHKTDESSLRTILQLCRRLGSLNNKLRGPVWLRLLEISLPNDSIFDELVLENPEKDQVQDAESIILAMVEACILRNSALIQQGTRRYNSSGSEKRDIGEIPERDLQTLLQEHTGVKDQVVQAMTNTLHSLKVPAALADPGLADVLFVLCSPLLCLSRPLVPGLVTALNQKGVLLLQFPDDENSTQSILKNRSRLLDLALAVHDREISEKLASIGPAEVYVPWRWMRCAFAGEMSLEALLPLWDMLVIDALPENNGDEGPAVLGSPFTGVWDGCDPRGPLAVYVMITLLLRNKTQLMKMDTTEGCLEVLRASLARLPAREVNSVCEEARMLRASTPLSVVQEAIHDTLTHMEQGSSSESRTPKAAPKQSAQSSFLSWIPKSLQAEQTIQTDSAVPQLPSTGWWKGTVSTLSGAASTVLEKNPSASSSTTTTTSFADRFKLTFGLGESSAKYLQRQQEQRALETRKLRQAISEHVNIVDSSEGEDVVDSEVEDIDSPTWNKAGKDQTPIVSATMLMEGQDNASMDVTEKENLTRRTAAQVRLCLSGLQKHSRFPLVLLKHLPTSEWMLVPAFFSRKGVTSLSMLLLSNLRVLWLTWDGDLARKLSERKERRYSKDVLLQVLADVQFVVQESKHIAELLELVLYAEKGTRRKVKLVFREDVHALRFKMRKSDCVKLKKTIMRMATELYC